MFFESILLQIASLRNEFILFSIVIGFPSNILYVAEIFTILRHKKFHNSFYILILVRSILNLLYTVDSYFGYRLPILVGHLLLPLFELLSQWNWALCLILFFSSFTMFGDYLATFFILLNRWTAIKMPVSHKIIWQKLLLISVMIIIFIPICMCIREFKVTAFIQMDNFNGYNTSGSFFIGVDSYNKSPIALIFSCGFLAISICLNISTIMAYRGHRAQVGTRNSEEMNQQKIKHRLLVYALLTFLGHVLMASIQILVFMANVTANMALLSAIYSQYPWTTDLGSVVLPSWLLFWASKDFRRHLIDSFIPKWAQQCCKVLRKMIVSKNTTRTIAINLADYQTTQVQSNRVQ